MQLYNRYPIDLIEGDGVYVKDTKGRKYLDFCSGIATNCLGHSHPALLKTLRVQSKKIIHTSNLFRSHLAEGVASTLCDTSFAECVFFCNSGTEAIETAIKIVRRYAHRRSLSATPEIITFENAFHGRSMGAISASGKGTEGFAPLLPGFRQARFNDIDSVKALINENTTGILIEPVQGEGGIVIAKKGFLQQLRALCDKNDILLVFDEIQTGIGRSGKLWAHQNYHVDPDVMTSAKGLGGGFPIGAVLATKDACSGMTIGSHGSTFGGNPLAMAMASTVLDNVLNTPLLEHVRDVSAYFIDKLTTIKQIRAIRSLGLLVGVTVDPPITNTAMATACSQNGLLAVRANNNTLRFLPPLIVERHHVDEAIKKIKIAVKNSQEKNI